MREIVLAAMFYASLCFTFQLLSDDVREWRFSPEDLKSRNCESSSVEPLADGECLVSVPGTQPLPNGPMYGDAASASINDLRSGLYIAEFMLGYSEPASLSHPVDMYLPSPSWIYCMVQTAKDKSVENICVPLWRQTFKYAKDPARIEIPFAVKKDGSSVSLSASWHLRDPFDGSGMRVRTYGISARRVDSGVFISSAKCVKLFHSPGEKAEFSCELLNTGDQAKEVSLDFEMITGISTGQKLVTKTISVPSKQSMIHAEKFNVGSELFGHEIRVVLKMGGKEVQTASDVFVSADNFWDVAVGAVPPASSYTWGDGETAVRNIEGMVRNMREKYCNWFEIDFWGPDDWGDLTPKDKTWVSAQAARLERGENIKEIISRAHANGIKAITYGKGMGGGPAGYEILRANPEFYMRNKETGRWGSNADLWDLDHWNDIEFHMKNPKEYRSDWHKLFPDLSRLAALDHGIQQLIDSSKIFGWDGVRFDGHFSAVDDNVSTFNMRRMKEKIWKNIPGYLFGFNMCSVFDKPAGSRENLEAMAGGSHWMQESIKEWLYEGSRRYESWRLYAEKEQAASEMIRSMGGTYHYCFSLGWPKANEAVMYYKFVVGTLNGAHSCYGDHWIAPGCGSWGCFLTRWGILFWHPARRSLGGDLEKISFSGMPPSVLWNIWAKSIPVSQDKEYIVIPLLALPSTDEIQKTTSYPDAVSGVSLDLSRTSFSGLIKDAWWLVPGRPLEKIDFKDLGKIGVPEISPLGIIICELRSCRDYKPLERKRFTEPVSEDELAKSLAKGNSSVTVDPMRPELNRIADDKVRTFEPESSGWSMRKVNFEDPDASGGQAAGLDKALGGTAAIGGYFDNLPAGRYRVTARVKAVPAGLKVNWQWCVYENLTTKAREGSSIQKNFDSKLLEDGKLHELVLTDDYMHYGLGYGTNFIHVSFSEDFPQDAKFMVDYYRLERLEDYNDRTIAEKMNLGNEKEAKAGPRSKVLWIRGLYDDLYVIDKPVKSAMPDAEITKKYQREMPKGAADLAAYGTIIMPNVPVEGMGVELRKAFRGWTLAGGHLVILGGDYSLGQGLMRGTFLEEVLPCVLRRNDDVVKLPEKSRMEIAGAASEDGGRLYYAHVTEARPDAEIFAKTGSIPLLMTHSAGKGRCTVFAGTVLGAPKDDPEAFWNGKAWLEILSGSLRK